MSTQVTGNLEGSIELLQYYQQQSICHNYHRYGNLGESNKVFVIIIIVMVTWENAQLSSILCEQKRHTNLIATNGHE
jgi:hypothetical protein